MDINLNNDLEKDNENEILSETSKKTKGFKPYSLITILLILILSIGTVASFSPLREIYFPKGNDVEGYLTSDNFSHNLGRLTNYLYHSKIEDQDWYDHRFENITSVKFAISKEDSILVTNVEDMEIFEQLDKSLQYVKILFDENGNPDVSSKHSINGLRWLTSGLQSSFNDDDLSMYANLSVIYIVPENFTEYRDIFTYGMKERNLENLLILILIIGGISILLLLITGFTIPYEFLRKAKISRIYNSLYLEIKMFLWLAFFMSTVFGVQVVSNYHGFSPYGFFNLAEAIYDTNRIFYIIGIPITFILFLLIYLSIVDIKYIYKAGLKETIISNSILGKLGFNSYKFVRNSFNKLITIDIKKDPNRTVFIVLIVNLFILGLIALGGGFMIILAIAYAIFLFKYLINYMQSLKDIHLASCQLAQGEFNISLNENIGMLRPIAENLNNIKEGFQLAVDKEIQSQKMKAELISNVSHDLKTPLTSIINYVDLLKNNGLSKETQQEYIGILDKKSKRLKILIEDLFEASKASSGNVDLYIEKIDIIALFRQTLGELEERIKESNLIIKANLPENKVICELDGKRTYRVFENIMSNIFKYALENSRVYIDVLESEDKVNFIFKNISSYEMNFDTREITERFARGDKSRSTEGSGLGLSIAKSLVEIQNGTLDITVDGDLFKLIISFPKIK